jgi:DNA-binding transcriptional regulator YiaG
MGVSEVRVQGVREGPGADKLDVGRVPKGETMTDEAMVFAKEAVAAGMNPSLPEDERVRNLYAVIAREALPDEEIDTRVAIVRELERLTCSDFKDTEDFHRKIGAYLDRKSSNADQLRAYRESKGWSQNDLAIHLAVSRQFVTKMEAGKCPLSDKAIGLICNRAIQSSTPPQNGCQFGPDSKQVKEARNGGE